MLNPYVDLGIILLVFNIMIFSLYLRIPRRATRHGESGHKPRDDFAVGGRCMGIQLLEQKPRCWFRIHGLAEGTVLVAKWVLKPSTVIN